MTYVVLQNLALFRSILLPLKDLQLRFAARMVKHLRIDSDIAIYFLVCWAAEDVLGAES